MARRAWAAGAVGLSAVRVSRRGLLVGAAAGGGLLVAWAWLPRRYNPPLSPGRGETAFGAWLKIGRDGIVSVAVPQLEMGQGVSTLLPQIVAMELGADWRQVAVEPAPISGAYANLPLAAHWTPLRDSLFAGLEDDPGDVLLRRWAEGHSFTATAEGTSLEAYERPCREAAAAARAMLAMAAAARWGADWRQCQTANGFVVSGHNRAKFGDLASEAAGYDPPDPPVMRPAAAADPALLGRPAGGVRPLPFPRLDLPAKAAGSYQFAGDIRLPDMVYAAIRHGPLNHSRLSTYEQGPRHAPGLVGIVKSHRWIAAVASNWWAAERAADALAPRFHADDPVSSTRLEQALDHAVRHGDVQRVATRGAGDAGLDRLSLALRYDVMPAVHGTLETATCTARLHDGRLELWLASQAPEQARLAAAKAVDLDESRVVLYPMPAGGSFDRRLEHDHAIEAAVIAQQVKRPVQLIWSRWQEQLMLRPRPPVAAVLAATYTPDGRIDTLRARLATPPSAREFGRRLFGNAASWSAIEAVEGKADPLAFEGLMPPYAIPNVALDHVPVSLPLPTGRMRGNAHGYTAFFIESFIDEVAKRTNQEPLSFRVSMLGQDVRLARCLQRAATLGSWGGGEAGTAQGIACHRMGPPGRGGCIAVVATATAAAGAGGVRVQRLAAAVDIGRVVNRDIALQQIEGGLLYGVALALGSSVQYAGGVPVNGRLAGLALPTMADAPQITVDLIASTEEPFDPGELPVAPVAPAIANALHSATGLRLRRLPLLSEAI